MILRRLLAWFRAWRVRNDLYNDKPERHPALNNLQIGELIPWKGTVWSLQMIREQPIPCLILVPVTETRASKLRWLSKLRRTDRIMTKQDRAARAALEKRAYARG